MVSALKSRLALVNRRRPQRSKQASQSAKVQRAWARIEAITAPPELPRSSSQRANRSAPQKPGARPAVCRLIDDRIRFPERVNGPVGMDAIRCLSQARQSHASGITLDFSGVRRAYPEGMMQVVAHVDHLRREGMHFDVILPNDKGLAGVFEACNWAHS
jgi:hypothetical protein